MENGCTRAFNFTGFPHPWSCPQPSLPSSPGAALSRGVWNQTLARCEGGCPHSCQGQSHLVSLLLGQPGLGLQGSPEEGRAPSLTCFSLEDETATVSMSGALARLEASCVPEVPRIEEPGGGQGSNGLGAFAPELEAMEGALRPKCHISSASQPGLCPPGTWRPGPSLLRGWKGRTWETQDWAAAPLPSGSGSSQSRPGPPSQWGWALRPQGHSGQAAPSDTGREGPPRRPRAHSSRSPPAPSRGRSGIYSSQWPPRVGQSAGAVMQAAPLGSPGFL